MLPYQGSEPRRQRLRLQGPRPWRSAVRGWAGGRRGQDHTEADREGGGEEEEDQRECNQNPFPPLTFMYKNLFSASSPILRPPPWPLTSASRSRTPTRATLGGSSSPSLAPSSSTLTQTPASRHRGRTSWTSQCQVVFFSFFSFIFGKVA